MHPFRTHTCSDLRKKDAGATVRLSGWVNRKRDHGGVIFIDLRDHYGLTQIVINPDQPFFTDAEQVKNESVITVTGQVVELQAILANKQTRGAFGEARMQAIVEDGLPQGAYAFQPTLSNGSRPDAIIHMPNDTPPLVVDAKFPLESYHAIRDAETPERAKIAAQAFRRDVENHIKAIASKYFIKGETQDTAFMFVPSESIFAEIHEKHETLVQKAHRARVVIISPSLLMLSIQVIQSVLKDHRMREQAHLIQGEVARLMEDVGRLDDRVRKLATHFGQAQKDVDDILTSSGKVTKRGTKIIDLEFDEARAVEGGKNEDTRRGLKVVE